MEGCWSEVGVGGKLESGTVRDIFWEFVGMFELWKEVDGRLDEVIGRRWKGRYKGCRKLSKVYMKKVRREIGNKSKKG